MCVGGQSIGSPPFLESDGTVVVFNIGRPCGIQLTLRTAVAFGLVTSLLACPTPLGATKQAEGHPSPLNPLRSPCEKKERDQPATNSFSRAATPRSANIGFAIERFNTAKPAAAPVG